MTVPNQFAALPCCKRARLQQGAAALRFADEERAIELAPGDCLYIAPHRRHRVDRTTAGQPTVWLAVHFPA